MIVGPQIGLSTTLLVATFGTLLAAFPRAIPETWNFAIVDQILHWLPAPDNSGQVVYVEIDDASLGAIGRWPWPRKRTAELIDKIHDTGAKAVVVDLFFPEAENPSSDQELAASLKRANAWIGYQFRFTEPTGKPCATNTIPVVVSRSGMAQSPDLFKAASMLCNIPMLESRSGGFLNASGRNFPMVIAQDGVVYPSLALASVASLHNQTSLLLHFDISYFATIKLGSHQIPLDSKGRLSIRQSQGDNSIPRIPALRLLHPTTDTPNLKGKLVVLGVHAAGIQEQDSTLLQATAIDNLLNGTAFAGPGTSPLAEWFLMIGALAAAFWPLTRLRGWKRWTPWTLLLLSLLVLSLGLFASQNIFVSPVLAIAGLGVQALPVCIVQRWQDKRNAVKIETQLRSAKQFTFSALAMLTTIRHAETGAHQQRIQLYLRSLALCLAARPNFQNILTPQAVDLMVQLAPIHDIGKVGIPDHILLKPGPLSTAEFELIQNHVSLGQEILDRARQQSSLEDEALFQMARALIYSHHERWDGTGYPLGLKGTNIPLAARMMAVADVYDALVSKRVYKDSLTHQEAVRMITDEAGRIFDPEVVSGFLEVAIEWEKVRTLLQEDKALGHHGLA